PHSCSSVSCYCGVRRVWALCACATLFRSGAGQGDRGVGLALFEGRGGGGVGGFGGGIGLVRLGGVGGCGCLAVATTHAAETDERSEEHTSELQSRFELVCRLLLETKNN